MKLGNEVDVSYVPGNIMTTDFFCYITDVILLIIDVFLGLGVVVRARTLVLETSYVHLNISVNPQMQISCCFMFLLKRSLILDSD